MKRIAIALLALSFLAACGLKGDLDRPPPLWGDSAPHQQEESEDQAPQN
jgi:predicted small lipoprotein YifL